MRNNKQKRGEPGKKKKKTAILQWSALLAAFIVVIIVMLFDSSKKILQRAESMIRNSIVQMAGKYSERVSLKLYSIQTGGEMLVHLVEEGSLESLQQIQKYLEIFCEDEGVIEAVYVEKGSVAVDLGGKAADLSQKSYYEAVIEPEESSILYIEDEEIADGMLFLFTIPVFEQESRILLYYPAGELMELINMSSESYRPTASALMDFDGNIFICTDGNNPLFSGGNLLKNITGQTKAEISKFQNRMRGQGTGRMDLSAGDQNEVVFHIPVGEKLVLIAEYDLEYITRQERLIWNDAWKMVLRVTSVLILFVLIYMVVNIIIKIQHEGDSKALEEKADTDLLTGLSNKMATERKIKEYISENPKELALMFVLDIDNFKKINDTMGHVFGDEVLRTLGKHIGENFRVTDIIGRTGGDEFTIFLKSLKDDSNTLREAQKLVDFFKEFEAGEYVKYSATASIGAAVFPEDGDDFETLYKAADQALYKAKERGKNQLAFYDDRDRV